VSGVRQIIEEWDGQGREDTEMTDTATDVKTLAVTDLPFMAKR